MRHLGFGLFAVLLHLFSSAQNVGIGVAIPTEKLHVDSTIKVGKNQILGTAGRKNLLKFGDDDFVTIGEEVADDKLYIRFGDLSFMHSSNSIGNGLIGINTETPSAQLDVNGSFRLRGNGAAAGRVLTSDASGVAAWSGPIAFSVSLPASNLVVNPNNQTSNVFSVTEYESNAGTVTFNPMQFTAPVSGYYHFSGSITLSASGTSNSFTILASFSNGKGRQFDFKEGVVSSRSFTFSFDTKLNAGDGVRLIFSNHSTTNSINIDGEDINTFFTGHLIR